MSKPYAELRAGDVTWVAFGDGEQLAQVVGWRGDEVLVRKWRHNSRRWTKPIAVSVREIREGPKASRGVPIMRAAGLLP